MRSALLIAAPEAESLVKRFRERFDPSAARGIPAHITLLFPFAAPSAIDAALRDRLAGLFAGFDPFRFGLTETRRFTNALYLAPEPAEPFCALTRAISAMYPEFPPYGGAFSEIVPHLTIAHSDDSAALTDIEAEFDSASRGALPIEAMANEVALMVEDAAGMWHRRAFFQLGWAAQQ